MVWCWWCCHPIEEQKTVGMPLSHDPVKNMFETYGHFCSASCMRSYNHNEPMTKKANQVALISLYLRNNGIDNVSYAPPRQMLDVFGGTMNIQEFRAQQGNTTYHLQLPHSVRVNHTIDVKNKSNYKWIKSANDNNEKTYSMKDFEEHASANGKVENNAIKIKPSQVVKKKQVNTIEMVLGLVPNRE